MNIAKRKSRLVGSHSIRFKLYHQMLCFLLILFLTYLFGSSLIVIAADEEYIINRGDQLIITIFGRDVDMTEPVVVRPDGMITYTIVGELEAAGLTISQLSANIRKKLAESGQYANPIVTVQLKESSQVSIYIIGDVLDPGQKKFTRPMSVVEALASAGGFKGTADLANATIIRQQKVVTPINLEFLKLSPIDQELLIRKIPDNIFMLKNGDVLSIPSIVKEKQVNIIGHVHNPGMYPVRSNINIIEALALAGGALEDSADLKHITIITSTGTKTVDATEVWKSSGSSDNLLYNNLINPGDSVIVPEKGKISILGFVEKQGQYAIADEITIIEALSLAGIKDVADLKRIKVVRSTGEESIINISKLYENPKAYYKETVSSGDIIIVPAKRFTINWNAVYSAVVVFSTLYAVFK